MPDGKVDGKRVAEKATILSYSPQSYGRSFYRVKCTCGFTHSISAWSWGGAGKYKCPKCKRFVVRQDLTVKDAK